MRKTKFTWVEWLWTNSNEDLFAMGKEQLMWYRLLIKAAP
jgi:hypothetical protein